MPLKDFAVGKKFATILAGRGCVYGCSFCSIREFYSKPPGPIKRMRRPEMAVREMELLHEQLGCSIFMFQDDDFPVTYRRGAWLEEFCNCLRDAGLSERVLWKINCRPDEIEREAFLHMKKHGLFLVYLGIESGTDEGLRLMEKRTTVEINLKAATILKELGVVYDYGFMLFDPWSTFDTVAQNLDFLEDLCGDGSSPVTFCKMLPYAETKIEKQLRKEGRLIGPVGKEDYRFHDPALDSLYLLMATCFADWIGDRDGLLNLARWVRHFIAVYHRYFPISSDIRDLEEATRTLIAQSNASFIKLTKSMISLYRPVASKNIKARTAKLKKETETCHRHYRKALTEVMDALESLGERVLAISE